LALLSNTSAGGNTAVGYGSLYENSTGSNNTALGHSSLNYNTIGADNTAIGAAALENNREGLAILPSVHKLVQVVQVSSTIPSA
jgi:hypothetical protein